jgi:hypothetical protein
MHVYLNRSRFKRNSLSVRFFERTSCLVRGALALSRLRSNSHRVKKRGCLRNKGSGLGNETDESEPLLVGRQVIRSGRRRKSIGKALEKGR